MSSLATRMPSMRAGRVFDTVTDARRFDALAVCDFVELFVQTPTPWLLPPVHSAAVGAHSVSAEVWAREGADKTPALLGEAHAHHHRARHVASTPHTTALGPD